jgi:hypothetical protein
MCTVPHATSATTTVSVSFEVLFANGLRLDNPRPFQVWNCLNCLIIDQALRLCRGASEMKQALIAGKRFREAHLTTECGNRASIFRMSFFPVVR